MTIDAVMLVCDSDGGDDDDDDELRRVSQCRYSAIGWDRKLICNFYLRVAACEVEQICPWDTLACCWDVKQQNRKANKQLYPAMELSQVAHSLYPCLELSLLEYPYFYLTFLSRILILWLANSRKIFRSLRVYWDISPTGGWGHGTTGVTCIFHHCCPVSGVLVPHVWQDHWLSERLPQVWQQPWFPSLHQAR